MFTDERRFEVWNSIRSTDLQAFGRILNANVFDEAAKRASVKISASPLSVVNLVWLGIVAARCGTDSFTSVLSMTLTLLRDQPSFENSFVGRQDKACQKSKSKATGKKSKHDPRKQDRVSVSEEAFSKARQRMPLEMWLQLIVILGELFQKKFPDANRFKKFRVLAMDGTLLNTPDVERLKTHFGSSKNKTGSHNCQAKMVLLQFPLTRMPYRYRLDSLAKSEITLAQDLVRDLRTDDLVLMDAGYWSYGLLCAIEKQKAYFALRLRKGITLKTIRMLQAGDKLVQWTPKDTRRQWRNQGLPTSMKLRLVTYHIKGYRPQVIVTNVLDSKSITKEEWTKLASDRGTETGRAMSVGLFHKRWSIETTYHDLKVVLGLGRNLRSRSPESIQWEVAGYIVYYLILRWLIVEASQKAAVDPIRISFKRAMFELTKMWSTLLTTPIKWVETELIPRLLDRMASHIVKVRPNRHYERSKKKRRNTKTKGLKG